jgi:hypothetical protein
MSRSKGKEITGLAKLHDGNFIMCYVGCEVIIVVTRKREDSSILHNQYSSPMLLECTITRHEIGREMQHTWEGGCMRKQCQSEEWAACEEIQFR